MAMRTIYRNTLTAMGCVRMVKIDIDLVTNHLNALRSAKVEYSKLNSAESAMSDVESLLATIESDLSKIIITGEEAAREPELAERRAESRGSEDNEYIRELVSELSDRLVGIYVDEVTALNEYVLGAEADMETADDHRAVEVAGDLNMSLYTDRMLQFSSVLRELVDAMKNN